MPETYIYIDIYNIIHLYASLFADTGHAAPSHTRPEPGFGVGEGVKKAPPHPKLASLVRMHCHANGRLNAFDSAES